MFQNHNFDNLTHSKYDNNEISVISDFKNIIITYIYQFFFCIKK